MPLALHAPSALEPRSRASRKKPRPLSGRDESSTGPAPFMHIELFRARHPTILATPAAHPETVAQPGLQWVRDIVHVVARLAVKPALASCILLGTAPFGRRASRAAPLSLVLLQWCEACSSCRHSLCKIFSVGSAAIEGASNSDARTLASCYHERVP